MNLIKHLKKETNKILRKQEGTLCNLFYEVGATSTTKPERDIMRVRDTGQRPSWTHPKPGSSEQGPRPGDVCATAGAGGMSAGAAGGAVASGSRGPGKGVECDGEQGREAPRARAPGSAHPVPRGPALCPGGLRVQTLVCLGRVGPSAAHTSHALSHKGRVVRSPRGPRPTAYTPSASVANGGPGTGAEG